MVPLWSVWIGEKFGFGFGARFLIVQRNHSFTNYPVLGSSLTLSKCNCASLMYSQTIPSSIPSPPFPSFAMIILSFVFYFSVCLFMSLTPLLCNAPLGNISPLSSVFFMIVFTFWSDVPWCQTSICSCLIIFFILLFLFDPFLITYFSADCWSFNIIMMPVMILCEYIFDFIATSPNFPPVFKFSHISFFIPRCIFSNTPLWQCEKRVLNSVLRHFCFSVYFSTHITILFHRSVTPTHPNSQFSGIVSLSDGSIAFIFQRTKYLTHCSIPLKLPCCRITVVIGSTKIKLVLSIHVVPGVPWTHFLAPRP